MKRVFVSYSRTNLSVVTQLVQDLEAVGVQTWHDQTLAGGQRWWDNVLENIRNCDIFIFALSPESWASEACRSELAYVMQLSKVVLPVLVADGINLSLLPAPINEIQVTDYRRCDKDAAFALVRSINTAPPAPPLPDALPVPPRVPVSYLSTLKERIDVPHPLDAQEQISLIFELEAGIKDGRPPAELRELFLGLKHRDELLAKVGTRIDEALQSLDDRASAPPKPHAPPSPQAGTARPAPPYTSTPSAPSAPSAPTLPNAKSRRYACRPADLPQLIADVKNWLSAEGFDSQEMKTEQQGILIQIKKRGNWRDFVGMGTSLNIVFGQTADTLTVEIGAGKWIDKAAVGTVSMFILWPLAVTAGFGAWEQMKMPDKIFNYIGNRFVHV